MARRKKQRRSNPNKNAISIINTVEGIMVANTWTSALFNNDIWPFLTAGTPLNPDLKWTAQGAANITLKELLLWPSDATGGVTEGNSRMEMIQSNMDGEWANTIIKSVLIGVGGKIIRKGARRPIRIGNKLLKQAGLRSMVRF